MIIIIENLLPIIVTLVISYRIYNVRIIPSTKYELDDNEFKQAFGLIWALGESIIIILILYIYLKCSKAYYGQENIIRDVVIEIIPLIIDIVIGFCLTILLYLMSSFRGSSNDAEKFEPCKSDNTRQTKKSNKTRNKRKNF